MSLLRQVQMLDGNGDYLEVLVQDDLTTLNSFRAKVQGHFAN